MQIVNLKTTIVLQLPLHAHPMQHLVEMVERISCNFESRPCGYEQNPFMRLIPIYIEDIGHYLNTAYLSTCVLEISVLEAFLHGVMHGKQLKLQTNVLTCRGTGACIHARRNV